MELKRITIFCNLALAAAVVWSAGSNPAKACDASHRSSYGSLMNQALAASMAQQSAQPDNQNAGGAPSAQALVGLWQETVTSGGQVIDQAFEVFHSDGTEAILDITPPAEENACFGVWVQSGPHTAKLKHPSWTFDANGNLTGTAVIRATITLVNENKFTGTYTINFYDTSGNPTGQSSGGLQGTRITVD